MSFFFTFYNVLIESVTLTAFLSWLSFRWRRASVTTLISILILETVISTAQETLATVCPSTLTDLTPRLTIYYFNVFFFCKIKVICQCNKTFFLVLWSTTTALLLAFLKYVLSKNKLVDKLILKFYFFLFIVRFYNDLNNMAAHVLFDAIDTSNNYHLRNKIRYLDKNRITDMAL